MLSAGSSEQLYQETKAKKNLLKKEIQELKILIKSKTQEYYELDRKEQLLKPKKESKLSLLLQNEKVKERVQPSKPNVEKAELKQIEQFTSLRMFDVIISNEIFKKKMIGRRYIPVKDIIQNMNGDDIDGDWISIGILFNIQKINSSDINYACYSFTTFTDQFRLFIDSDELPTSQQSEIGSIVAVLNPKIIIPSEQRGSLALLLKSPKLYLKLGSSLDLSVCKYQQCQKICNSSITQYCETHSNEIYLEKKHKRQEFAQGDSIFHQGAPIDKTKKQILEREYENNATYRLNGHTIVCNGSQSMAKEIPKQTVQKSNREEIEKIIGLNIPAAENIRIAFGQEKKLQGNRNVFGPSALARMGGNPFSPENQSKFSPEKIVQDEKVLIHKKSGMVFKRGTSDLVSPSKKSDYKKFKDDFKCRKRYESDSDCELEITTNVKKTLKVKYKDQVTVLDTAIFGPKVLNNDNVSKKDVVYQTVGLGLHKKKATEEDSSLELEIEKD